MKKFTAAHIFEIILKSQYAFYSRNAQLVSLFSPLTCISEKTLSTLVLFDVTAKKKKKTVQSLKFLSGM